MQFLPDSIRDKHIYLPGLSGHGKTTAMMAHAIQDIRAGRGVCFLDPAGDAVKRLLHWIPRERANDTYFISPTVPIPMDFMSYEDGNELDKARVIGDLIHILIKDPSSKTRITPILRDALYTIMDAPDRTFLDVHKFFEDPTRQKQLLQHTTQEMRNHWKLHPPEKSREYVEGILARIQPFVRDPTLRVIFGTPNPRLKIADIVENNKVLLVDRDDSEAGILLAQLIFSKLKTTAFRRRDILPEDRDPFCLYCDEFQDFQMPEFEKIITQGRKYAMWLTLANQGMYQLEDLIHHAVLRVYTYIFFCLAEEDVKYWKGKVKPFDPEILAELPEFKAIYKIGKAPAVMDSIPPPAPPSPESYAQYILKRSGDNAPSQPGSNSTYSKDDDNFGDKGENKGIPPHGNEA